MHVKVIVTLLAILSFRCEAEEWPEVETPLGRVRGFYNTSFEGRKFSAFEGIPYAVPPIGDLRFTEPQLVKPWTGVLEANQTHECVQLSKVTGIGTSEGDEDCLYVNIYSPTEVPSPDDNLDVIVCVHGGSFLRGAGSAYVPTLVMDKEILMVTLNYRVGVLGFLCTMDENISCNNGLKDQTMALRWVQRNIKSFGGNPNSVTLVGQSAGGASVHYHFLSPLSKGLFHRGFSLSGTALDSWAFQHDPLERALRVANSVGCNSSSNAAAVECLKDLPALVLESAVWDLFDFQTSFPIAPLAPSLEPESEGAFLPDHPYKLLTSGNINDVPWLTSVVSNEGLSEVGSLINNLDILNNEWDEVIHLIVNTNRTAADEDKQAVAENIRHHYFGNGDITSDNVGTLAKMLTDRGFKGGFQKASQVQAKVADSPVYDVLLAYVGANGCSHKLDPKYNLTGVCHADDLQYLFSPPSEFSESDNAMRLIYLNMLESFVKTDKPDVKGINWLPVSDPEILTYLYIQDPEDISLRRSKDLADMEFWDSLPLKEYENE